jgi:hypothetical protein
VDVEYLFALVLSTKISSPFTKRNMDFINLYLSIPNEPWDSVSMDFMIQLVKWTKMDVILIIVNQFCKLTKVVLTKTISTIFYSMKSFFDMWVRHHGMLQFIVNDRDAKFIMGF